MRIPRLRVLIAVSSMLLLCAIPEDAKSSALSGVWGVPDEDIVQLETIFGHGLTAFYNAEGRLLLTLENEGNGPGSDLQAIEWQGGIALRSVQHDRVLGLRDGVAFFGLLECPEATDCQRLGPEEVLHVHEELVGSFTITLKTASGIVLGCNEQQHCSIKDESEVGMNEMFVVNDATMRSHINQLRSEGYTVIKAFAQPFPHIPTDPTCTRAREHTFPY
jgi:hypothetical protein